MGRKQYIRREVWGLLPLLHLLERRQFPLGSCFLPLSLECEDTTMPKFRRQSETQMQPIV